VNYLGKLGNGSLKSSSKPDDVSGLTKAVQISTGQNFACALIQDGTVKCWGSNGAGELGTTVGLKSTTVSGDPRQYSDKPVSVVGVTNAVQITTGSDYACALLQAGTVKCWGGNLKGDIEGLSNVVSISADLSSLCALLSNGRIKCLGSSNYFGELGNGTGLQESKVMTPTEVVGITNATQIANGFNSACAILATGVLKCWGQSFDSSPITVASGSAVVNQVARPALHFCRILQNANVECWGANNNGQVTDGSKLERSVPVQTFEFGKQFANVPTAKITGSALIGSVLTGVPGSWPAGAQLAYAWLKNGSPISGATTTSLTLTEAMNGSTIQFQVTGTAAGYATAKSVSAATSQVAYPSIPVQGTPKITSSLSSVRVGAVLTVNVGTWAEGVQTTIDWKVDGQSVQNSGTTLEVTSQMQGKVISVVVAATKSGFATATKTVATKAVAKGQILKTRELTIGADGSYSVGAILGLNWGSSPDPMLEDLDYSIRYVWKVNGVVIADATDSQYQIRQSDLGKKLSASITLSMPGYEDLVLTSKSTTAVVKGNLLN
jgi:alpha-tubulin suppressor-like RCC1 family protein